jgi:hypothetical protein
VYDVRGAVTVGAEKLTGEKTALEYNGTLVFEKLSGDEYLAKFSSFVLGKYDKLARSINDETFGDLKPEEQRLITAIRERGVYEQEMQKHVKFSMKEGEVVRMDAGKDHQQWSLNIFRGVFTLLQNQVRKPTSLAVPFVAHKYEDGITGNCNVQYEILSQPEYQTGDEVYNMTKTVDFKNCHSRPVYRHLKDAHRGCAGVCDNHKPENFLDNYEEERTDFELKPTPGCPVNKQRGNSLVTLNAVTKYNITGDNLQEAYAQSTDIYRLFGSEVEVRTHLKLTYRGLQGAKIEEPKNTETYTTLQQRLPVQEEGELDIPIFALMKEHSKHQLYPQYFQKHFDAVVRELHQLPHQTGNQHGFQSPIYMIELIQAVSGMTEEELQKTIPQVVRQQQAMNLPEEAQIRRQLWIELLGKAGTKASVKIATDFIKNKTFTPTETRRVLQDIAGFLSYPDTEMIEQLLGLCLTEQQGLTSTGKATACVAAGKAISKGCDSEVFYWTQREQHGKQLNRGERQLFKAPENEEYEITSGHLPIEAKLRCTPEKLQQYVQRLSRGLRSSTGFKQVVAYINGLAKIQKPEVLPELIGYVNGTASNIHQLHDQGEQQHESIEFVRRVAIIGLRDIATKYPKEVNPIVRVIYLNTTEQVHTRLLAFDTWMNTQPAQWEVEKVMQVANKDDSFELTHYVYTALKSAMLAKEPCYQLLSQRIRAAWTQIRPFDSGLKYSQFRSKSFYNLIEDFGVRGVWKVMTSNTTVLPGFTQAMLEQTRGPYMKTLFGAKLLVKGGDKIWNELTGKDGLLERIAHAVKGQVKSGEREQQTERLMKDIAEGMDITDFDKETPKAVLFWKLFSGEAVIPMDAEYVNELKQELLQTVSKFNEGGVSGHFLRVFAPTKAFHVEPTTVGFPIVHSTIHPIIVSVRYENVKFHYGNQEGRVVPKTFEVSGDIKPVILSFRQTRVFVAEKTAQLTPTLKTSNIKEFKLDFQFYVGYEHGQRRFTMNLKPRFERIFHSAQCTELDLVKNTIIDEEPATNVVDYKKCVKSLYEPVRHQQQFGGKHIGMTLRVTGESHQPWFGLPMFGSGTSRHSGFFYGLIERIAKGTKHHAFSVFLDADKQQPMNEWSATFEMDSNLDALTEIPLERQAKNVQNVKIQYKTRPQGGLKPEFEEILRKIEAHLQENFERIDGTTIEQQLLAKLEGRYQGQAMNTLKFVMKKVNNFEETEQQFAFIAESKQSPKSIEVFGNVSYPAIGSFFHFDPTYVSDDTRMNGTIVANIRGVGSSGEQSYRIGFENLKSEEQRTKSELEWFEVRCLAEQEAGLAMTDACKKAMLKDNSLDRMEMTIELPENAHPSMERLAKKILTVVKYNYYQNMKSEISGRREQLERGEKKQVKIYADTSRDSQWSLLYNVRVEMPQENVTLSNIRLPGFRPVHMQLTRKQQIENIAARGEFHDVCVLGKAGVRTYDNVTFNLDVQNNCEYLLTRDQTEGPADFIVTFKVVNQETSAKKVRVQLRNTIIELEPFTPSERYFNVHVNGTQHRITFDKPVVFYYGGEQRVFINAFDTTNIHDSPIVHVYTESEQIRVLYNGHSVQTVVDQRYKGRVSGICGNNDNEKTHEFIGPHGHEYEHSNEFIASFGVGQECKIPVHNTVAEVMQKLSERLTEIRKVNQEKYKTSYEQMSDHHTFRNNKEWQDEFKETYGQSSLTQLHRSLREEHPIDDNEVLIHWAYFDKEHVCFTRETVPVCKIGFHKEWAKYTKSVEAICVEASNPIVRSALEQVSKRRVVDIDEIEKHSVKKTDFAYTVRQCVRH